MRLYLILIIFCVVFLALGVYTQHSLQETSIELSDSIDSIVNSVNSENWSVAEKQITVTEKLWDKTKYWWSMVIDHQEIDQIELSLAKTGEYIKSKNKTLSSGELSVLKVLFEHIPIKEAINLKNIF